MAGDEDNRHLGSIGDESLQVEAIEVREADIEDQATRSGRAAPRQELLRRREDLGRPARAFDEQFQRLADRGIVVDDENDRWVTKHEGMVRPRYRPALSQ